MSIQSEPYYWAVCDRCGDYADYDDEYTGFTDSTRAVAEAEGWLTVIAPDQTILNYCPSCTIWTDDYGVVVNPKPYVVTS